MTDLVAFKEVLTERFIKSKFLEQLDSEDETDLQSHCIIREGLPIKEFIYYLKEKQFPRDQYTKALVTGDFLDIDDHEKVVQVYLSDFTGLQINARELFPFFKKFNHINYNYLSGKVDIAEVSVECDFQEGLQIAKERGDEVNHLIEKATEGHLQCLQYLCSLRTPEIFSEKETRKLLIRASQTGSLDCLRYLVDLNTGRTPIDNCTFIAAARAGSLDCLRFLVDLDAGRTLINDNTFIAAAKAGSIDCIKFLQELHRESFDLKVIRAAASSGHLDCLKYVCNNADSRRSVLLDKSIATAAAASGSIDCLLYLHGLGTPFDVSTACVAARKGSFSCL